MKWQHLAVLCALATLAAFMAGYNAALRRCTPETREVVRIDTVYYERPSAIESSRQLVSVNVPRWVFAPAVPVDKNCQDVICQDLTIRQEIAQNANFLTEDAKECANFAHSGDSTADADSVRMFVEMETRTYGDSLYHAQVSGPAIGPLRPQLDWVHVYERTRVQTVTKRNRFAVSLGVGAAYTPHGIQPTIGAQVGVVLWGF